MITRFVIFILAMGLFPAYAAIPTPPRETGAKLVVTVSLSQHSMTIRKHTAKRNSVITAWIMPIQTGTMRPGKYRLKRMQDIYETRGKAVQLENVILTNGNFHIRSTPLFKTMMSRKQRVSHTILLSPEDGSMLFTVISQIGLENTLLRVIP